MEENIALDSQKQRKFVKSIKGIKKLIKKNVDEDEPKENNEEEQKAPKSFSMRLKSGKVKKRKHERGLVYLAHIPHGFYEHQMTQYFRQFGVVTNARVIRSKRTGTSKGCAFVEFKDPSVGEIVADTMNNYLMGKRLIKAAYIPPEKQKRALRKRWNRTHNPASEARLKTKKAYNADKDETGEINRARKYLKNLNKTKKRLSEMGINYDFFTPVDIPEALLDNIIKQEKDDNVKVESKKKTKKEKKAEKSEATANKNVTAKDAKITAEATKTSKKTNNKVSEVERVTAKINKKEKLPAKVNKQEQKDKQQKLKDAGVKPVEEFIKVQDESDDSDSSYDFDSDEYDKILEQDDDDLSSGESEQSEDEDVEGDDDEEVSEEEVPQKQVKGKPSIPAKQAKGNPPSVPKVTPPPHAQKQAKQQEVFKKFPQEVKRKAPSKLQGSPKKPKFEKQSNQKPMKKQFKKK